MTNVNGTAIASTASTSTDPSEAGVRWAATAPKTPEPSGATRSKAAAIPVHSVAGSLSESSAVSHATGFVPCSDHCVSRVVLPYPAGATTVNTGASDCSSRSNSAARRTAPARATLGCNFDDRTLNGDDPLSTPVDALSDRKLSGPSATAFAMASVDDITRHPNRTALVGSIHSG